MKRLKETVRELPARSFTGLGVPTLYMKGASQPNRRGKVPRMPVADPDLAGVVWEGGAERLLPMSIGRSPNHMHSRICRRLSWVFVRL
jgi:hypothetical protein